MSVEAIQPREPRAEQRVVLRAPWSVYEALTKARGNKSVPRMAYRSGVLEIVSPSYDHEWLATIIGRLLEGYATEHELPLNALRSWTLRDAGVEAGAEPDECYVIGDRFRDRPDLVLEVAWTAEGIDKLEIYREFGIPEVWFWRRGHIEVHVLRAKGYIYAARSALFPALDLKLLESFIDAPQMLDAVKRYRQALRSPKTARKKRR